MWCSSSLWAGHVEQMRSLFAALSDAGLVMDLRKCESGQCEMDGRGRIIRQGKVSPRGVEVRVIGDFPLLRNVSEMMHCLFMSRYCR